MAKRRDPFFVLRGATAALLLLASTSAMAADPVPAPLTGDRYDQLTIALFLAEQCKTYRGYEFAAIRAAAQGEWAKSSAKFLADKAASEAAKSSVDPARADAASVSSRAAHMNGLRERARSMGCGGGLAYLQNGFVEAYSALGATLTTAWTYRGQAALAPGFTALTPEEKQIVAAFVAAGKADFAANWPDMEMRMNARAQTQLAAYAGQDPSVAAALVMGDHRNAFASIRMESAIIKAGYSARGALLPSASPYGLATLVMRKDGAPTYVLTAPPKAIGHAGDDKASPRGYIAFTMRSDGSGVIGLFGEDVPAKAASLTAGMKNKAMPGMTAVAFAENCPFEKCFAIPAERMRAYAKDRERLSFYGSTLVNPTMPTFELYALQVGADDIRAATAAAASGP